MRTPPLAGRLPARSPLARSPLARSPLARSPLARSPVAGLLAALAACSGSDAVAPGAACSAPVALTVGAGTQPAVSWAPACAVQSITVAPAGSAGGLALPLWQAQATDGGLTPPVQVGGRPEGATVWGAGEALTPGTAYTVYVGRGGRGSAPAGADSLTFTARAPR